MGGRGEIRELLIADLAVRRGIASAPDVAAALQRFWAKRNGDQTSFAAELARVADVTESAIRPVAEEAERLIEGAGGDPLALLTQHGPLTHSVHAALTRHRVEQANAPIQSRPASTTKLRVVDDERYADFIPAGEGGMGVVYMALDTELNRLVAFKMVRPVGEAGSETPAPATPLEVDAPDLGSADSASFGELRARFLQEAWVTGGLEHPGVVPVYELGETKGGVPYYTMRFVRGQRTLKDEIRELEGQPVEKRLQLLEPFLKLCDTVRYAHSRGVVHRDLKPENVALGEFGEVVLLDWGLAKLAGEEDVPSIWRERVEQFREAEDLKTLASAIGTPGYMAPEAAQGRTDEIDAGSDVFGLGVILFEILTGARPFPFRTFRDYLERVSNGEPQLAHELQPAVPEALSRICASCLALKKSERMLDVEALAKAIRAWQAASAIEREVDAHLRDANAALDDAETAVAETRLSHVDRAAASLQQVATKVPDHHAPVALGERVDALRERGIREREKASGRKLLTRVGVVILALAGIAGYVVAAKFDAAGRELEGSLERVLRLADAKKVNDLLLEVEGFTTADPEIETKATAWLRRADELRQRLPAHRRDRDALREHARMEEGQLVFDSVELAWQHQVLSDLVENLEALGNTDQGAPKTARWFRELGAQIGEAPQKYAEEWREAIDYAASSKHYGELELAVQRGIVPLGPDPSSGLLEFAHIGSGSIPSRDADGELVRELDFAVVLVLVPGGTFQMGAQAGDVNGPNYDPDAFRYKPEDDWASDPTSINHAAIEQPVHAAEASTAFLAKYECTQAQWRAITGGLQPSFFGHPVKGATQPVDTVSWSEATRWLAKHGLVLPREELWEYACRARTRTPWYTGNDVKLAHPVAWTARDAHTYKIGDVTISRGATKEVGQLPPNVFGLHDMHGNVWELCSTEIAQYAPGPYPVRLPPNLHAVRGGSWYEQIAGARSATRRSTERDYKCFNYGFRAARVLSTK